MDESSIEVWDMLSEGSVYVKISSQGSPVRVSFWIPEPDGERDELELMLSAEDAQRIAAAIGAAADQSA